MFVQLVLVISAVCLSSLLAASVPAVPPMPVVNRGQTIDLTTGLITISHDDGLFQEILIYPTCPSGGSLAVQVKSLNGGSVTIQVGAAAGPAECRQEHALPNPSTDGETADILVIPATGGSCGRQVLDVSPTSSGRYQWQVKLTQVLTGGPVERSFENNLVLSCTVSVPDLDGVEVDDEGPQILVPEFPAEFEVAIEFTITKADEVTDGKWSFELSSVEPQVIVDAGQEFKIVECIAIAPTDPPSDDELVYDLITSSCIRDRGVSVDTSESPLRQTIRVAVFRFTANPTATVTLQCKVVLCAPGALCPTLSLVSDECPADGVTEEPATEEPVTEEPVTEEPITEEPLTEEPLTEEPVTEESIPRRHVKAVRKISPRRVAVVRRALVHRLKRSLDKVYVASTSF